MEGYIINTLLEQKQQLKSMAVALLDKNITNLTQKEFKYQLSTIAKEMQKNNDTNTYNILYNYICIDLNRLYEHKKKQIKNNNIFAISKLL